MNCLSLNKNKQNMDYYNYKIISVKKELSFYIILILIYNYT